MGPRGPPAKQAPSKEHCRTQRLQHQTPYAGVPYVAGLSEQLGRVYKAHNIYMYHKPANALRSKVVHPKDKTPLENVKLYISHHLW